MKKLFYVLLGAALVLCACSKEDDKATVSFSLPTLALTSGTVTLDLQVKNVDLSSLTAPVKVPVTFSGTAVKGTEYSVSAEEFVLGGSEQSLSITVTALDNYDEAKEIVATLGAVADFELGKNSTAKISLGVKPTLMYSFASKTVTIGESGEIELELYTSTGSQYTAEYDITIPIVIDEASTAVEGENFTIEGEKQITVAQGKSSGTLTVKAGTVETGKDKIVFKANVEKGFVRGQYNQTTVTIFGSYFNKIIGTWKVNAENSYDPTDYASSYTYGDEAIAAALKELPAYNENDRLTFTAEGLTTSLESNLKNFFKETSNITNAGEYTVREGMGTKTTLQLVLLDNVNRYFSATEVSEDTEAYIGIYFSEENPEQMVIYFPDIEPRFLDLYLWADTTKPVLPYAPYIKFAFDKVTE